MLGAVHYNRTVLGYHGCDESLAAALLDLNRKEDFKRSDNEYDWLGSGVYFWEHGPDRAWRWAEEQAKAGRIQTPAVLGAIIHLGKCFDLLDTRFTSDLRAAFEAFCGAMTELGRPLPENEGKPPELKMRFSRLRRAQLVPRPSAE